MRHGKVRARLMAGACGVFALAAVAEGGTALLSRAGVRAAIARVPGLEVGTFDADPLRGRVFLRRASLSRGDIRITAERVDVPLRAGPFALIGSASAADGATTSADNIRIEANGNVLAIPHLELKGASLGKALAALSGDAEPAPGESYALTQLSLDSLTAPLITFSDPGRDGPESGVVLHDLAVSGVADGRIASVSASGFEVRESGSAPDHPTLVTGKMEARAIDVGLASTIGSRVRTEADEDLHSVLGSFTIADIAITPKTGEVFKIGAFDLGGLSGRPLTFRPNRFAALADTPESLRSEEEREELIADIRDAAGSVILNDFAIRKVSFAKVAGTDPVAFDLDAFTIGGFAGLKVRAISATSLNLKSPEVTLRIGSYETKDLDETGLLDLAERYVQRGTVGKRGSFGVMVPPWLGEAAVHDIFVSAPTKDDTGNVDGGRRIEISVPLVEMSGHRADGQTASESTARVHGIYDIVSPTPGSSLDESKKNGFDHFDVTSDYALSWDEKSGVMKLDHVTMAAKNLASVTFGATVSGLSQEMLAGDEAAIAAATRDMRFQALNVGLTNAGLFEKALPVAARGNKTTVPELKVQLKAKIGEAITQALGDGPAARQIDAAVVAFIDKPKTLSLAAKAKGDGLDLDTIKNAEGPDDLFKLLDITVSANK